MPEPITFAPSNEDSSQASAPPDSTTSLPVSAPSTEKSTEARTVPVETPSFDLDNFLSGKSAETGTKNPLDAPVDDLAVQLGQGGSQCSDRAAGDVVGDAEQAKRVRTVEQTPQSWLRTSGLPVAVRRQNPRTGEGHACGCFAPSRRRLSACALRLQVIRLQGQCS